MAVMRAQVSLMFDDADLFENFIIPCKEERRLNGIIVKCLKAYYLDERVRGMIEGGTEASETEVEGVQTTQEICDSIRASLIMQDYLVEELKQTVDNGVEDVESILSQANKKAESHGFGASYQTKSGSTILQLEAPKQQPADDATSPAVPAVASAPTDLASILCQAVLLLAKDSNNSQVTALLQQVGVGQPAVTPPEPTETVRQMKQTQVPSDAKAPASTFVEEGQAVELESGSDFDEEINLFDKGGAEPEERPTEKPADKPKGEDASGFMADLLNSL